MIFNRHFELKTEHAFLGASSYHWLNDDGEELRQRYLRSFSQTIGTVLHAQCADHILYRVKLLKTDRNKFLLPLLKAGVPAEAFDLDEIFPTLYSYVNDAIAYRMTPEQKLVYSPRAFGTADTIGCDEKKKVLRISDLKTGLIPGHMEQLEIYAAYFFLEYGREYRLTPANTAMELRIYQRNEVVEHRPEPERIKYIMDKVVRDDKMLEEI